MADFIFSFIHCFHIHRSVSEMKGSGGGVMVSNGEGGGNKTLTKSGKP